MGKREEKINEILKMAGEKQWNLECKNSRKILVDLILKIDSKSIGIKPYNYDNNDLEF